MAGRKPTLGQRRVLEELRQRVEKLETMVRSRDEFADAVAAIAERLATKTDNRLVVSDYGKANLRRYLGRYELSEILEAIDDSFAAYLKFNKDDEPDLKSWEMAFRKIPVFSSIVRAEAEGKRPHIRQLIYIQGILRVREREPHLNCLWYLEHLVSVGIDPDQIERLAKRLQPEDFKKFYDDWLTEMGRPI